MASSASMLINYPTTFCGVRNSSNPNNDQFSDQINIPSSLNNNKITNNKTNKIIPKAVASPVIPSINSNNITTIIPNIKKIIHEFDPKVPAQDAFTPPSTWYTEPSLYSHELDRIFYKGWQVAGYSDQIKEPNQYFTGSLGNVEYLVCRDGQGKVHAFHNVCTHRASILACGTGKKSCFVCPYHGWVFGLDGSLMKATKTENQVFDPQELGLVTLKVAIWGPFVLISLDRSGSEGTEDVGKEWIGSCAEEVKQHAFDPSLQFINRSEFPMESNWKIFCDNYLDSAYHVPYAHKYYAAELDFDTYKTDLLEKVVIQRVASSSNKPNGFDRLGSEAFYAFIYPNFAVERYGPWMTTMHIVPLAPRKCKLVVDYYLDKSMMNDKSYIEKSIEINDNVQKEDVVLCESVQRGLETPAYRSGRYVMPIEKGIHHFHCWLHQTLN